MWRCREVNKHKDAQPNLVGRLMQFMEPFTTRGNLLVRCASCNSHAGSDLTGCRLHEVSVACLEADPGGYDVPREAHHMVRISDWQLMRCHWPVQRLLNQGKTKVMTDYGDAKDKLRGHLSVGCQAGARLFNPVCKYNHKLARICVSCPPCNRQGAPPSHCRCWA